MKNNINTDNTSIEDQFHWYSLRVISGKERVVEENINYEAKLNKIDSSIEEVFVPFEKVIQIRFLLKRFIFRISKK